MNKSGLVVLVGEGNNPIVAQYNEGKHDKIQIEGLNQVATIIVTTSASGPEGFPVPVFEASDTILPHATQKPVEDFIKDPLITKINRHYTPESFFEIFNMNDVQLDEAVVDHFYEVNNNEMNQLEDEADIEELSAQIEYNASKHNNLGRASQIALLISAI